MPCVLNPEVYADWLDPGNQDGRGLSLLLKNSLTGIKILSY
jgi:hypothetical protein